MDGANADLWHFLNSAIGLAGLSVGLSIARRLGRWEVKLKLMWASWLKEHELTNSGAANTTPEP